MFALSFLRYLHTLFTKIAVEKINDVATNMFQFLHNYFKYIKFSSNKVDVKKESFQLLSVINIIIFSLFSTIEGFNILKI